METSRLCNSTKFARNVVMLVIGSACFPQQVCLDLRNVCNFQSGTALHIRKYCGNLTNLVLEIDPSDGGGGGNSSGALAEALNAEQQSVWMLQNQVQDLQSRLNQLQV